MCKKFFSIKKFKVLLFLMNHSDRIYMINKNLEEFHMLNAVLFDLDGTLIDTNELIIDSFKHTFKVFSKPEPDRETIIEWFGEPLAFTISNFFDNVNEAIQVYRDFNLKYHDERISIYNNVEMILKTLKEDGYKLGVVTSKNKSTAFKGLNRFNISHYFDVLIGSDDVKNHKPHEEPILNACKFLNVKPSESIMIGDSIYDIISGRNAGTKTCGVLYSFMKDKLVNVNADYYISDLIELVDIVSSR